METSLLRIVERSLAWWHMPLIPALRRLRQEDREFPVNLGYIVETCLKK
jgi:hypothetical protein